MATRGVDIRQSTDRIVFRASLKSSAGAKITSGTTELRLYRVEDDGTLDVYDWTTNDFVAPGSGTPDDETAMTHQQRRDSTGADVDTGIWTTVLSTLTNFVAGQVYIAQVTNSTASPESQEREFQFGGVEGNQSNATDQLSILADTNELQSDWADGGRLDLILDATKTDTGNLVTRITSTLFSGITSLAQWLGLMAGKQTANSTALAEIKATGAGSGTYSEATDSLEALRDRGDAAWTGGGGGGTIYVTPVASTVSAGEIKDAKFTAYQGSSFTMVIAVIDEERQLIDLTGKSMALVVYSGSTTLFQKTTSDGISVASQNQVTITGDEDDTETTGKYRYDLWNTTDDVLVARGVFEIIAAQSPE